MRVINKKTLILYILIVLTINLISASTCPSGVYPCNEEVQFNNPDIKTYSETTSSSSNPFNEDIVINKLTEHSPINFYFNFTDGNRAYITYTSDNVFGFINAGTYAFDNNTMVNGNLSANEFYYNNGTKLVSGFGGTDTWQTNYTNYYTKAQVDYNFTLIPAGFTTNQNNQLNTTGSPTFNNTNITRKLNLASSYPNNQGVLNIPNIGTTAPSASLNGDVWQRSNLLYYKDGAGTIRQIAHTSSGVAAATYSTYMHGGTTLSNNTNKTGNWEYFGLITLSYSASYLQGHSINTKVLLNENSRVLKNASQLEEIELDIRVTLKNFTSTTTFNTNISSIHINVFGETTLTGNDFACLTFSSTTAAKVIRCYVRLKDADTHYTILNLDRYGRRYTTNGALTTNSGFTYATGQAVITNLPTPSQGSIVYGSKIQYAKLNDSSQNITANYFIGDGSQLTGISAGGGFTTNQNNQLNTTGNVTFNSVNSSKYYGYDNIICSGTPTDCSEIFTQEECGDSIEDAQYGCYWDGEETCLTDEEVMSCINVYSTYGECETQQGCSMLYDEYINVTGKQFIWGTGSNTGLSPVKFGIDNIISADYCTISGGYNNEITAIGGVISGGGGNYISGFYSYIGSGYGNELSGSYNAITSGFQNKIVGSGFFSIIGGGLQNYINGGYNGIFSGIRNNVTGTNGLIIGGADNKAGTDAIVLGGSQNTAFPLSSVVLGGYQNRIPQQAGFSSKGIYSVITHGSQNNNSGQYASIGGRNVTNEGEYSLLFGTHINNIKNKSVIYGWDNSIILEVNTTGAKLNGEFITDKITATTTDPKLMVYTPTTRNEVQILDTAVSQDKKGINVYFNKNTNQLEYWNTQTGDIYDSQNKIIGNMQTLGTIKEGYYLDYSTNEYYKLTYKTEQIYTGLEIKKIDLKSKSKDSLFEFVSIDTYKSINSTCYDLSETKVIPKPCQKRVIEGNKQIKQLKEGITFNQNDGNFYEEVKTYENVKIPDISIKVNQIEAIKK